MREQSTRDTKLSGCSLSNCHAGEPGGVPWASQCSLVEGCGAPLCPLAPGLGVWFHGEPTCRSRKQGAGIRWLQTQRRIARLENVEGYFTRVDLERIRKVRRGIRGSDPDADRRHNTGAQRGTALRGRVLRGCARNLGSEPMKETSQAADTLSPPSWSARPGAQP
jgi:hypothetical protein